MSETRNKIQRIKSIRQTYEIMSNIKNNGHMFVFTNISNLISYCVEYMIDFSEYGYRLRLYKMGADINYISDETCFNLIKDNLDNYKDETIIA